MTDLAAFHLPGLDVASRPRRALAATPFTVPDLEDADVARVWQSLATAAAAWRARPAALRAERLAEVTQRLAVLGPGRWAEPLRRSTGLSTAGFAAAWQATFAPHDRAALSAALAAEPLATSGPRAAAIVHVVSGNLLPATLTMLLRGWLVGAPQWLRPAGREPLFAACVLERLAELAPEVAACAAVLWWPHASALEAAVLRGAGVVTVQGDDATVAALETRTRAVAPGARFVGYGARWSAVLLSHGAQTDDNARRVARDVALFDQQGCLSPSLVLAEDGPRLAAWCARLGQELARIETQMPRGRVSEIGAASLRLWRERQRLGAVLGDVRASWESDATSAWAVALQERGHWEAPPLERHVVVLPFGDTDALVATIAARLASLQGLAVDLGDWDAARAARLLARLRPTRVSELGALQLAPVGWPQDHHAPLASLVVGD